jgi:hypothetical protein
MRLGPTATRYGPLTVTVEPGGGRPRVRWQGTWREPPSWLEIRLSGRDPVRVEGEPSGSGEPPSEGASA